MKKRIILTLLLLPVLVWAQDESQSVELPDFVITGVKSINLPVLKKAKPELVQTLSEEFFYPSYSPEEFTTAGKSDPIARELSLFDNEFVTTGLLRLKGGMYTLPFGDFTLSKNYKHALLQAGIWGENITEYEDNAGYNVSGGKINTDFFISNESDFLPGLKIGVEGEFSRDKYHLYGSTTPKLKRETDNGFVSVSVINNLRSTLKYGAVFSTDQINFRNTKREEVINGGSAFVRSRIGAFGVKGDLTYKSQDISTKNSNNTFFNGNAAVTITPSNNLYIDLGITYAKAGDDGFFMPRVNLSTVLEKNISIYAGYKPYAEFYTGKDFKAGNRYFDLNDDEYIFTEYSSNVEVAIKYEYKDLFEANGGFSYMSAENYFYYEDIDFDGVFDLQKTNEVKNASVFLDVLVHPNRYGMFYGSLRYSNIKENNGNVIPYEPAVRMNFEYGYRFPIGITVTAGFDIVSSFYSDLANNNKVDGEYNLSIGGKYNLFDSIQVTLDIENLMNRDNYRWANYKEKPFDIVAGINYRW